MLSNEKYSQLLKSIRLPDSHSLIAINSILAALRQCATEAALVERAVWIKREQLLQEKINSLQEQPQIAYGKHEFCKSMNCPYLTPSTTCGIYGCFYTAKRFHHWLQENNFKIIKEKIK